MAAPRATLAVCFGVCCRPSPATPNVRVAIGAATLIASWGKALEVPGTATLNVTGQAQVHSISRPAAGNCAAGGFYDDASHVDQAFVAGESHGKWGKAKELPGTAALNVGGQAYVENISCAAPGYCSATGSFSDGSGPRADLRGGGEQRHMGTGGARSGSGGPERRRAGEPVIAVVRGRQAFVVRLPGGSKSLARRP
jgi:hypothetical protein